jgi:3-deoxy-7-phosphoheptulonate synthase
LFVGTRRIQDYEQLQKLAVCLERNGLSWLWADAPGSALGAHRAAEPDFEALDTLRAVARSFELKTLSSVFGLSQLSHLAQQVDALLICGDDMDNTELLAAVGQQSAPDQQPVLLVRNKAAMLEELLVAADLLTAWHNPNVMFCESGIRSFETAYPLTLDITAVPLLQQRSLLPVAVEVSAAAQVALQPALARAALAAGADALLITVEPTTGLDAEQEQAGERWDGASKKVEPTPGLPQQQLGQAHPSAAGALSIREFEEILPGLRHLAAQLGKKII